MSCLYLLSYTICGYGLYWLNGQLHFDLSITEFRYIVSSTSFADSLFAGQLLRFIIMVPFGCWLNFTGEVVSFREWDFFYFVFNCTGTSVTRCFLKTETIISGMCNGECAFSIPDFRVLLGSLIISLTIVQFHPD